MILCAALDTLFESQELLSSQSTAMMMLDKSQSCRCWFESIKKSKMFLIEMPLNVCVLISNTALSLLHCAHGCFLRSAVPNVTCTQTIVVMVDSIALFNHPSSDRDMIDSLL